MTATDPQLRERALLALLAAIQVTHIMDFMVMMPLGPQLMRVFHVTPKEFGLLVSAYTFGAAASGFFAAFHIDRFDRKTALLGIYAGFAVTTLLCALAPGFWTLLAARAAAGIFGGIAGAVVYAIVSDLDPRAAPRHGDGGDLVGFLALGHRRRPDRAVPREPLRLARTVRIAHGRERAALDRRLAPAAETGPASACPPLELDEARNCTPYSPTAIISTPSR